MGFTLSQRRNNLRIYLNATVVLNLTGWCDITCFLKRDALFRVISFHSGCIRFVSFTPPYKIFITLCSDYNHLTIINQIIYQSKCKYILPHTTHRSYIVKYIFTLLKILQQNCKTVKQLRKQLMLAKNFN